MVSSGLRGSGKKKGGEGGKGRGEGGRGKRITAEWVSRAYSGITQAMQSEHTIRRSLENKTKEKKKPSVQPALSVYPRGVTRINYIRASQRYKHVSKPLCLHPVPFSVENGAAVAHVGFLTHGLGGKDEEKNVNIRNGHVFTENEMNEKHIWSNNWLRSNLHQN